MSLQSAWNAYSNSCRCGKGYAGTNCAHFLSEALIGGGFSSLDGGEGADMRKNSLGMIVCTSGRPIRAKELRDYFRSNGTRVSPGTAGVCFVYQERNDGQGHVLLKWANDKRGTGDYPDWPIQEWYKY